MTDQTEPKLQVNDWAIHVDGYLIQIAEVQDDGYGVYLGGHTLYSEFVYFDQIKHSVAVHPIEHHKCKDCEHFAKYFDDDNQRLNRNDIHWWSTDCPLWAWARDAVSPCGAGLNLARTQIGNNNYDYENLEPPPDCYCFTPKLSPDEKESK